MPEIPQQHRGSMYAAPLLDYPPAVLRQQMEPINPRPCGRQGNYLSLTLLRADLTWHTPQELNLQPTVLETVALPN